MPAQKELSQEEIWDDSALLQSWDEALNEYKMNTADQVSAPEPASDGVLASNLPQSLVGEAQDESLKNLMMSWYWAGYYTGLNEGLNQAKQEKGKRSEKG
ncbi:hypothetical protein FGG08_001855 [Glutinoglossum americanum]|uniref:Survival Motor Neuron Gemin2-binding domain-containing protein n=1 Tax=Glutinoglossum americanum TaxID=1670608 RepID=A0A9P8L5Z1_9PEZI|nr:hypothetical protein FGG08_001855 [Glutinoglossum americanum]